MGVKGISELETLVILPVGAPSAWHVEHQGEVRHLHLYLSPTLIKKIAVEAGINPDTVQFIDAIGVTDPQIETIALSFLSELRFDGLDCSCSGMCK